MEECDYIFDVYGDREAGDTEVYLYCNTHRWSSDIVQTPNDVAAADHKHKQEVADGG